MLRMRFYLTRSRLNSGVRRLSTPSQDMTSMLARPSCLALVAALLGCNTSARNATVSPTISDIAQGATADTLRTLERKRVRASRVEQNRGEVHCIGHHSLI